MILTLGCFEMFQTEKKLIKDVIYAFEFEGKDPPLKRATKIEWAEKLVKHKKEKLNNLILKHKDGEKILEADSDKVKV